MSGRRRGLFLIGHGSRSGEGVDEYWQFVEVLRDILPADVELGAGFIEFASPDLDEGIDELVSRGVEEVHAVPLVLLGAGHMKNDGPAALARARLRHPGVTFCYARALGVHPDLLSLAEARVREAFSRSEARIQSAEGCGGVGAEERPEERPEACRTEGEVSGRAVVLVGRGSTDPDANSDLFKVARMLEEGRSLGEVHASFVSLAPPDVPSALDRAARLGATAVAVVPYFLFTGLLVERIYRQAEEWALRHPEVQVVAGRHLGPDPVVARLVVDRFVESVEGGVHMNCDGCVYRVKLPGYEHKFRAPLDLAGHHAHHHHHSEAAHHHPHEDRHHRH
ncbi:MAG: cobalamin biosynthesis protein CbiX [Acidimicrobiales bacterium]|nr:MAG: cobalamin biosynthesis protein CbiX [Acidimicrobiales bacterium]